MASITFGDVSPSPAATTSMSLFLYWLQTVLNTFDSVTPPLRLIIIDNLGQSDKKLREINPFCSLTGPHDVFFVVLL